MKKFWGVIITLALIVGGVGLFIYINNVSKGYAVEVTATAGGSVELVANDKEYVITADSAGNYSFKSGTKLKLTAIPDATGEFLNWVVDGKIAHANPYELTIDNNAKIKAEFKVNSYNVTVKNEQGNTVKTFIYSSANFLDMLTVKMADVDAGDGYKFVYEINDVPVTRDTVVNQDVIVVCKKEAITYTVTFKNGEKVEKTAEYTVETKDTKPEAPVLTKRGYTPIWKVGNDNWSDYTLTTGDVIVNVNWSADTYTITFKYNNEVKSTENYTIETTTKPNVPSVDVEAGYRLVWKVGDVNWSDYTLNIDNGNIDVVAEKEAITYTVTFKNGTETVKTAEFTVLTKDTKPEAPVLTSRVGYEYTWKVGDTAYADYTLPLDNVVVNAVWTEIPYTISFKYNGEIKTVGYTVTTNKANIVIPTFNVEEGYELVWSVGSTSWSDYSLSTGDFDVTAERRVIPYVVTFKNGTETVKTAEFTVLNKDTNKPEAPVLTERRGYEYTWKVGNTAYADYTLPLDNVVVDAVWTATPYTITFKYNNEVKGTEPYTIETTTKPNVPSVDVEAGYRLVWKVGDVNWSDYTLNIDNGNIDVVAEKEAITYTVTFKNGTETVKTAEFTVLTKDTKPEAPTITGYNTTWIVDDGSNWDGYVLPLDNVVVNANKTAIEYRIVFKDNDDVISTATYTIEKLTKPTAPDMIGTEWVTWQEGSTAWEDIVLSADNLRDITLTVASRVQTYKVTINTAIDTEAFASMGLKHFTATNGNVTFLMTENDSAITLPAVSSDSYDFLRWVNTSNEEVISVGPITADVVITGVWVKHMNISYNGVTSRPSGSYVTYSDLYLGTDGRVYQMVGDSLRAKFASYQAFVEHINNADSVKKVVGINAKNSTGAALVNATGIATDARAVEILNTLIKRNNGDKTIDITFTFGVRA